MADKILVAYYSKTGHTKAAAQKIAKACYTVDFENGEQSIFCR